MLQQLPESVRSLSSLRSEPLHIQNARCLVPLLCVEVGWFPGRLYEKIEPYLNKDFEIDAFTAKETLKKEVINITLPKDKPAEQIRDPKPA